MPMNKPDQNNQAECCKDAGQDDKNQKQYSYIGIITDEKVLVSQSFVILANVSDLGRCSKKKEKKVWNFPQLDGRGG